MPCLGSLGWLDRVGLRGFCLMGLVLCLHEVLWRTAGLMSLAVEEGSWKGGVFLIKSRGDGCRGGVFRLPFC